MAPTSVPAVVSSLQRVAAPGASIADVRELAASNNALAFDLYQAFRDEEGNLLYSPYSISQALAMIYAGARGQTGQQMADTLHFTLPQERLHTAFNALDLSLAGRSQASTGVPAGDEADEVAFELHIANALWGQEGYSFLPEYLDVLAQNYGAGIQLVDFADGAGATDTVNRWVNEETRGRIPGIVDSISPDVTLVLVNAIYFNARWDQPFDEKDTRNELFYLLGGDPVTVSMMHQTESFGYTAGDGYQAIELPYLGKTAVMVILLPEAERFQEIEGMLGSEWVKELSGALGYHHEVALSMPRFRFETPVIPLAGTLASLGMPDAFSPGTADLSGIDGTRDLAIGRVLHKAFIEVNEQRTEAAAATVEEVTVIEMVEPVEMRVDRPFIFFIRDVETDTILFLGRVVDPTS